MMVRKTIWVVSAGFLVTAGCSQTPAPQMTGICQDDTHCEAPNICVDGACMECDTDTRCASLYPGEGRTCQGGSCTTPECSTDEQCQNDSPGYICRDGTCVPECIDDSGCDSGQSCIDNKCADPCAADGSCSGDLNCQNGYCLPPAADSISLDCRSALGDELVKTSTIYFDFNTYDLSPRARQAVENSARCLNEAPQVEVILEGHCDARGTQEYNLALGQNRAEAVRRYLQNLGVNPKRIITRSKGENEPTCMSESESCHADNRRVRFVQRQVGS